MYHTLREIETISQRGCPLYDTKNQLRDYVYAQSRKAFDAGDAKRDAIQNIEDLRRHQQWVSNSFLSSIQAIQQTPPRFTRKDNRAHPARRVFH